MGTKAMMMPIPLSKFALPPSHEKSLQYRRWGVKSNYFNLIKEKP